MYPDLADKELQFIYDTKKCPDCEGTLYCGAMGGIMLNTHCGTCEAVFNIATCGIRYGQRISFGNPVPPIIK